MSIRINAKGFVEFSGGYSVKSTEDEYTLFPPGSYVSESIKTMYLELVNEMRSYVVERKAIKPEIIDWLAENNMWFYYDEVRNELVFRNEEDAIYKNTPRKPHVL